ncbi:MAG: hypothetical protein V4615_13735, partial [Bacteroidota bacterium]
MKYFKDKTKRLFFFIGIFSTCVQAFATHSMGKDIQYSFQGVSGGQVYYHVVVRFYRNCWDNTQGGQALSAPNSINLEASDPVTGFN